MDGKPKNQAEKEKFYRKSLHFSRLRDFISSELCSLYRFRYISLPFDNFFVPIPVSTPEPVRCTLVVYFRSALDFSRRIDYS